MRPRVWSNSRSRRIVISELEYFLASSRTRARPFWFTKSTMARRRSSFITEVRLTGMVPTCVRIRSYSINSEEETEKGFKFPVSSFKRLTGSLVDRYGFHQITGVIHIEAVQKRDEIGR